MKKILGLSLILAAMLGAQPAQITQTIMKTATFPIQMGYTVEFPPDYDSTQTYPLIVAIHGFGDKMTSYTGTAQILCPEGAIGLYPESAYPFPSEDESRGMVWTWWYWSDSTDPSFISNEVTLRQSVDWIVHTVEQVKQDYPVDADNVFLFGFSQGGFLTFKVGLEHPYLFRGLLPAGGWMDIDSLHPLVLDSAALDLPVRILHGEYDSVVKFQSALDAYDTLSARGLPVELMRYPADHALTSELFDDARDFVFCMMNNEEVPDLVSLIYPDQFLDPQEQAQRLDLILCSDEPVTDIEAGLLDLYENADDPVLKEKIIYLLGAKRCVGAELMLTGIMNDNTQPQELREASYIALKKLATESAWKTTENAQKQVVIMEVVPGSQAEELGLEPGDVVVTYNKKKIKVYSDVNQAKQNVKSGQEKIRMEIERAGERISVVLKPGMIGIRLAEQIK